MSKRILIVDDDKGVAFFLREHLLEAQAGYQVETADSSEEALEIMAQRPFDLVITDLRMPGMDGLELMEEIRQISPRTRLILMTAYGNERIERTAYQLGACQYITKPFRVQDLIERVDKALAEVQAPGRESLDMTDQRFDELGRYLADLRFEVGAQCILLADVAGQLLTYVGEAEGLDLPTLVSLMAGGFATAFEMAHYLGEKRATTLNYHEGRLYDVYSSNVDDNLFIVLIFDKRKQESRIGIVWLYTRRALQRLQELVGSLEPIEADQVLDADFGALLSNSLDQLLIPQETEEAEPSMTLEEATNLLLKDASPPQTDDEPTVETIDWRKAQEMGLIDLSRLGEG